jgi:hypothetical protein
MTPRISIALVLTALAAVVAPARADGLIEGKCGIAELGSFFSRCSLLESREQLSVLVNNGSNLLAKASSSEILRIGPLDAKAEQISPGLSLGIKQTLAGLGVSIGDARRSSNVKIIQLRTSSAGTQSLVFVAARSSNNLDQFNAILGNVDNTTASGSSQAKLVPTDSSKQLEEFERTFSRIEGLYNALMFEEADRIFDRTQAEVRNFGERYRTYEGVDEVVAVLRSRVRQLESLRSLRSYDYQISVWQAEQRYNRIQREKAAAEARRRQHEYRMAAEQRKIAEANALKWWAIWMATRPALINTTINNVIITR